MPEAFNTQKLKPNTLYMTKNYLQTSDNQLIYGNKDTVDIGESVSEGIPLTAARNKPKGYMLVCDLNVS